MCNFNAITIGGSRPKLNRSENIAILVMDTNPQTALETLFQLLLVKIAKCILHIVSLDH